MKKILLLLTLFVVTGCSKDEVEEEKKYHTLYLRDTCYTDMNTKEIGPYCVSEEEVDRAWEERNEKGGPCPEITFYTLDGQQVTGILGGSKTATEDPCG